MIADDLREFVSDNIDQERIEAVIEEGYKEGYQDNPERKEEIDEEIRDFVKNGLKDFCEYNPDLANLLHLQKVIQQPQLKQAAPQVQVQQSAPEMKQPEAPKAAAPGIS